MIALLHASRAFGAVEEYAAKIAAAVREGDEPAVLVYVDDPALAPFAELEGGSLQLVRLPASLLDEPTPLVAARLARTLRRLRPRVIHVLELWPPALVAARLAGSGPVLLTHHTPELPRRDSVAGRLWLRLGWWTRPTVVYTSASDQRTDGRRPSVVVELGIDIDRFASAKPATTEAGPVIGNVARLAAQKGQRQLIEAAPRVLERHPQARFVIVGEGELREELELLARNLDVEDSVVFTGFREDVPELLASFDVFAFPSLFEGLCLAVVEAQAAGVPVVATPVGGIRETVVPGETGVLCRPGDADSLAEGILALLDDPAQAKRLAEEARRRAVGRFGDSRMIERTLALYT